jgi:hypothetical protein
MRISVLVLAFISVFTCSCTQTRQSETIPPQRAVQYSNQDKYVALHKYVKDGGWIGLTKPQLETVLVMHDIPHNFEFQATEMDAKYDESLSIPIEFGTRTVIIGCKNGVVVLMETVAGPYIPE